MKLNKIEAAGLSRILQHSKDYQSGTISAFRPNYSAKENMSRHRILGQLLHNKGYNKCQIQGVFDEGNGTKPVTEISYFVWDTKNKGTILKDLIELGDKFEQHSITFAEANSDYRLIAANTKSAGVKSGTILATFKGTSFGDTKGSPSYSKIRGRPFMWDNYKEVSIGKVEAYKQLKENVNYLMVRHYGIKKLENQIGKVSATQMIENAKAIPDHPLSKFILGKEHK